MVDWSVIVENGISELKSRNQYDPKHFGEENLYTTYILISELLDPNNSYDYKETIKHVYKYTDMFGVVYGVRFTYNLTKIGDGVDTDYFELKTWWEDENGGLHYGDDSGKSSNMDMDKRANTLAKIFRDEILPFFKTQKLSSTFIVRPIDKFRYRLSIILINKFIPTGWEVEEKYPKMIIVTKS